MKATGVQDNCIGIAIAIEIAVVLSSCLDFDWGETAPRQFMGLITEPFWTDVIQDDIVTRCERPFTAASAAGDIFHERY